MAYPEGFVFSYTAHAVVPFSDIEEPLYKALLLADNTTTEAILGEQGYHCITQLGDSDGTSLKVYSSERATCYAEVKLSNSINIEYIIPTGHDLLCFLREFTPTIAALVALENESAEQKRGQ
ncbi:hypothetical protein [Pseudomonas sp.]|uniref:hypothetical protein n=1 Tax=Pseudomonas sp. TaxID=306 RepID=UPI00289D4B15|nr:hypothetical protein [Pseudomonas sp.]